VTDSQLLMLLLVGLGLVFLGLVGGLNGVTQLILRRLWPLLVILAVLAAVWALPHVGEW